MAVNKVVYDGATLVDLTGDTVTAADLADGVKATGADGNPIVGIMQKVTIDAELSTTSTNPVQNKVIYNALLNKVGTDIFSGFALMGATSTISWGQGSQPIGSIDAINYTGTAAMATRDAAGNTISTTYASKADVSALLSTKLGVTATAYAATRDGAGNNIAETYAKKTDISGMVKSVNGTKPDASGNVNVKEYTHPASGVTAGSYRKVTVDTLGHVTAGENPILAVAEGGTGADNATSALSNLGILGAIVNASVSGTTITFTKKDNTKITIDTQDTNNGIVAALLEQNGYVKFSNGLILQWGLASTSRNWMTENKYPISFRIATFAISLIPRNPAENSIYAEPVGVKLCTKTGFYGGLQITCDTDNLFYIAIGI